MIKTDYIKSFDIKSDGFEVEAEITAKVFRSKLRVYEVPITYEGRTFEEGKKADWRVGGKVLWALIKYRFWYRSVGEETLYRIAKMRKFNWWLFNKLQPYLGDQVLEAGCGTGTLSHYLRHKDHVCCVDFEESYINKLKADYCHYSNMDFRVVDLGLIEEENFTDRSFDSIICINVLEHVEHDKSTTRGFSKLLCPGGRLLLYVPAFPSLYCGMDKNLNHFRRYTKRSLQKLLKEGGFEIERLEYANLFGYFGWLINGKVLKKEILGSSQLAFYESLTPIFKVIENVLEKITGLPFGLSLYVVARKPKE
jgi:2-polyprenyl-3-methyl-5-hydroxy-6-metoxy-1,4-benzoquinol methylase